MDLETKKARFQNWLSNRLSLRDHMVALLAATCFSGVCFDRFLYSINFQSMMIRYPVSVALSYFMFFIFFRTWLRFIFPKRNIPESPPRIRQQWEQRLTRNNYNSSDPFDFRSKSDRFQSAGGRSGGGGASASFGDYATDTGSNTSLELPSTRRDNDGTFVVIVAIVCVIGALGSATYLIVQAPEVLSEAAFQFALGAGMVRTARRAVQGTVTWESAVFKTTRLPFFAVLFLAFTFGTVSSHYYPEATTMKELWSEIQKPHHHP